MVYRNIIATVLMKELEPNSYRDSGVRIQDFKVIRNDISKEFKFTYREAALKQVAENYELFDVNDDTIYIAKNVTLNDLDYNVLSLIHAEDKPIYEHMADKVICSANKK